MKATNVFRAFRPALKETDLPEGVIGQVAGIALVYGEIDSYGTTFARGALERTMRERVAAGKVKLFWDHGDAPSTGWYDSDLHIGTVRLLEDVQLADGRWAAYMEADLIDTPKAREVKLYLLGLAASGGETGLSIGGRPEGIKSEVVRIGGKPTERITEFPLQEISITSMQSVPDSEVLAVRAEEDAGELADDGSVLVSVAAALPSMSMETTTFANEPVVVRTIQDHQVAVLDALLLALPHDLLRAKFRATLGDATTEDSDAAAPVAADSDADAGDSRTTAGEPPVVYATMEERLTALRQSYGKAA